MTRPAFGVRVKSGWAAVVLLGGSRSSPRVLDARRLELADPETPASSQPYHAGAGTAQSDARVVRRLIALVERRARTGVAALLAEYRGLGQLPRVAAVIGTGKTDPTSITNPHIRIHALEGRLFRRVVQEALNECGVRTRLVLQQAVLAGGPAALGLTPAALTRRLAALRPPAGGPWRSEQKVAALAAWVELALAAGRGSSCLRPVSES